MNRDDAYLQHVDEHAEPTELPGRVAQLEAELQTYQQRNAELRAEAELFRIVADFTFDWEYWIAPDGTLRYVSPSCERITGYQPAEFRADPTLLLQIVHPDDREWMAHHLQGDQRSQKPQAVEFRIITRSGEERWIGYACQPIYDAAGTWLGRRVSNRDITEQKRAEEELAHALTITRAAVESATGGILVTTLQGSVIIFNRRFVELWQVAEGWDRTDNVRERLALILDQIADPDGYVQRIEELFEHPEQESYDVIPLRDGRIFSRHSTPYRLGEHILGRLWSYRDITEQRRAEEALRESETFYRAIFKKNRAIKLLIDPESGAIVDANQAAADFYGYPLNTLLTLKITDINTLSPEEVACEMQQARTEQRQYFLFRHRLASGEMRDVEVYSGPLEVGGRTLLFSVIHDITARKQAEEAYRTLVDNSLQAFVIFRDGRTIFANPSAERITGYSREELLAMSPEETVMAIHPDDRSLVVQRGQERQSGKSAPQQYSFRIIRKDGAVRWLEAFSVPTFYQGQPAVQMTYIDITERKRAEEALRESERRYRTLVQNFPDGVVLLFDQDMRYLAVGGQQLARIGMLPEMLEGKTLHESVPPDIAAIGEPLYRAVLAGEAPAEVEQHYGGHIYRTQPFSVRNEQGEVVAGMLISQDITERKQMEEALRESEERYRSIFENATIGIFQTEPPGRFLDVNPALARILGYASPQELIDTVTDIAAQLYVDPSYREHIIVRLNQSSEPVRLENRYYRKDGSIIITDLHIWTIRDEAGNVRHLQGFIEDITERKQAEQQVQRANELLVRWINTLKQHNYEAMQLAQMGNLLQGCKQVSEAYEVVALIGDRLFDGQSGALYICRDGLSIFDAVASWGDPPPAETMFSQEACRGLQQQQPYFANMVWNDPWCAHCTELGVQSSLCVPLVVQNEVLGLLHLRDGPAHDHSECKRWQQLAGMVAQNVAMALTNLMLREQLQHQAVHDSLTGLFNRRYLDETLPRELQRARRHEYSLGIIMLDIDHFKRFNDTYGHDAGDALLRAVGTFLQAHTRSEDIVCRYGGEEFTLVLPGASLDDTCQRAEDLRESIKHLHVQHRGLPLDTICISLGVAIFPQHSTDGDELVKAADMALYQAKAAGRDRTVIAYIPSTSNPQKTGSCWHPNSS